jgi:DNA repair protein RecN (Recombination protein N)
MICCPYKCRQIRRYKNMLSALRIQNYALLKDIEIDFTKGLNILTGETGAGKSIIIGAINTAIGERGYLENIRTGEDKAIVEAIFDFKDNLSLIKMINEQLIDAGVEKSEDSLVIRREISRTSKGKIHINNTNASLAFLEKIGKLLIDIHGQHEHQSLLKNEIHMDLLDDYAGNGIVRSQVLSAYNSFNSACLEIKKLTALENEKQERLEMVAFRLNELELAELKADTELEELNRGRDIMINTEAMKESVNKIIMNLSPSSLDEEGDGAIDMVHKSNAEIEEIAKIDKKSVAEYGALAKDAVIKLEEIKEFFVTYREKVEFDKDKLAAIEARITLIESLMKKYKKAGIAELKKYHEELKEEKKNIELNSEIIAEKEKEKIRLMGILAERCAVLSDARHKKSVDLGARIESELRDLGIAKGRFLVEVKDTLSEVQDDFFVAIKNKNYRVTGLGINTAEFMISLNPGEDLKPLVKVASGGEISRIMLSIKNILSAVDRVPVMVFDEIDTGISGKIAGVVGKKLKEISRKKQLLCITHLPQIAAYSDTHYSVEKHVKDNKTETLIVRLGDNDKIKEIAKLLSGDTVTETSLKAAKELIENIN